jgi:hypothetical protein
MPLSRQTFPVGALGCKCTIVSCPKTGEPPMTEPRHIVVDDFSQNRRMLPDR